MYCSVCGARVPTGRTSCDTCGARVQPRHEPASLGGAQGATYGGVQPMLMGEPVHVCPRCSYRGPSTSYFSRGVHVAALVGLAVMTWGLCALGYYLLRHNHRVCPRCGLDWGKQDMLAAASLPGSTSRALETVPAGAFNEGSGRSGWAIFFFLLAAFFTFIGLVEVEAVLLLFGGMSAAAGWLTHQKAQSAREARRQALITGLQQPVLQMAARRKGMLTVTQVAAELGWSLPRAEKVLNSLDDGLRVASDVTDEGVIVYYFRELMHAPASPSLGSRTDPPRESRPQLN